MKMILLINKTHTINVASYFRKKNQKGAQEILNFTTYAGRNYSVSIENSKIEITQNQENGEKKIVKEILTLK